MDDSERSYMEDQNCIKEGIRNATVNKPKKLEPLGYCHYCLEDVEGNKLFCNGNHAHLYALEDKLK